LTAPVLALIEIDPTAGWSGSWLPHPDIVKVSKAAVITQEGGFIIQSREIELSPSSRALDTLPKERGRGETEVF
jgi:hypothetical protein